MAGLFNLAVSTVKPTLIESDYSTEVVEDWSRPVLTLEPFRVHCEPLTSSEEFDGMGGPNVSIDRYRIICEPGARPRWDKATKLHVSGGFTNGDGNGGGYLSIVGEPGRYATPFLGHLEFICEKVGG